MARKVPVIGAGGFGTFMRLDRPRSRPVSKASPPPRAVAAGAVEPDPPHRANLFPTPPGHDGWTEGDEACVLLDFGGLTDYAVPKK